MRGRLDLGDGTGKNGSGAERLLDELDRTVADARADKQHVAVVAAYGLGLVRAWQLLGARRFGLLGWLNVLREMDVEGDAAASSASSTHEAPATSRRVPPATRDRRST